MENGSLMKVKSLQNAPFGAFCNTLTSIKGLLVLKTNFFGVLFEWLLKTGFTVFLFIVL